MKTHQARDFNIYISQTFNLNSPRHTQPPSIVFPSKSL